MKALCKWVHLMIQLNMIKKTKASHIHMLPLFPCWSFSHTQTRTYTHTHTNTVKYLRPFVLSSSMPVRAAICAHVWLSSQGQQHTQSSIICSKPNVHNMRAGLTPRLLKNTHQHSERLILCDVAHNTNRP